MVSNVVGAVGADLDAEVLSLKVEWPRRLLMMTLCNISKDTVLCWFSYVADHNPVANRNV
jgi:hypothetical protein